MIGPGLTRALPAWRAGVAAFLARHGAAGRRVEAEAGRRGTLTIAVAESGWRMVFVDADGMAEPPLAEVAGAAGGDDAHTAVAALRRAVRAIPARLHDQVGAIAILAADPAIDLLDSRAARIRTPDPVALRQLGSQQVGEGASYGFVPFGQSSEREVERGLYGFIAGDRLREYLSALNTLADRLVSVVPAAAVMLDRGQSEPFVALDVQLRASTILVADPETGAVALRTVDVGATSFAAALAEIMSIPLREAVAGLERRDGLPENQWTGTAPRPLTSTSKALAPVLERLVAEIRTTLDYFSYHRLAGSPARLLLTGEGTRLQGFAQWLSRALGLEVEVAQPLLDSFLKEAEAPQLNLLEGSPDGLLTLGKIEYRYLNGRFEPRQRKPATPVPGSGRAPAGVRLPRLNLGALARHSGRPWRERINDPAVALPACLCGLVAAGLWLIIDGADAGHAAAQADLASAQAMQADVDAALARRAQRGAVDGAARFLWTEKLLALSAALPDQMWLTRIDVAGEPGRPPQRLVLEGAVPANAAGQLDLVSRFVTRLEADADFMRDFRAVTFDGSSMAQDGQGDVVSVTISAWFDDARRRDLAGPGAAP
ncbi:hypothetical protein [Zavarzinia sp. CC-PAN008]|uniref:hypothetical protein n=1 Tax=Zavarzinia sp. CC-PAN008 TaxID=3243332 RepID=UPI003F744EA4